MAYKNSENFLHTLILSHLILLKYLKNQYKNYISIITKYWRFYDRNLQSVVILCKKFKFLIFTFFTFKPCFIQALSLSVFHLALGLQGYQSYQILINVQKFNMAQKISPINNKSFFSWKNSFLCDRSILYSLFYLPQRYTNADLKVCQYLRLHMKIICWRFHIKTSFTFWDMYTWDIEICEKLVCKHSYTIAYVKN